jgi:hypothetical protein
MERLGRAWIPLIATSVGTDYIWDKSKFTITAKSQISTRKTQQR